MSNRLDFIKLKVNVLPYLNQMIIPVQVELYCGQCYRKRYRKLCWGVRFRALGVKARFLQDIVFELKDGQRVQGAG